MKFSKTNVILSALVLLVVVMLIVSVIFGWFIMNEDAGTNDFIVNVTNISCDASLEINNELYAGNNLIIDNALPGSEYVFELSIVSSQDGLVRLSFINPEGEFYDEEYEESGDMGDVMAVRYPTTSSTYTTINNLTNGIIASDISIEANVLLTVEFIVFFNDVPPVGKDINLYQGKTFSIEKLKIEVY